LDNEFLQLDLIADGFDPEDLGIRIDTILNVAGELKVNLVWNYDCETNNLDGFDHLSLKLVVDDLDDCNIQQSDTIDVDLSIIFPPNTEPELSTSLAGKADYIRKEYFYDELANFSIFAEDLDNDDLTVWALPANFNPNRYQFSFDTLQGSGAAGLNGVFSWHFDCELFTSFEQDSFRVYFFAEDFDRCQLTNRDTLIVDFILSPRPNRAPVITANDRDTDIVWEMNVWDSVHFDIVAEDSNGDQVFLQLVNANRLIPELGLIYLPGNSFSEGPGKVSTSLSWVPTCDLLGAEFSPMVYEFQFAAFDDACPEQAYDTLRFEVSIEHIQQPPDAVIPNVFTPNVTEKDNPYFMLDRGYPLDDCSGVFERVSVYNRWGKNVFESNDRDFKWDGEDYPPGIYYYELQYSNRDYRGTVSILY